MSDQSEDMKTSSAQPPRPGQVVGGQPLHSGFSVQPESSVGTVESAPWIACVLALIWWLASGTLLVDWLGSEGGATIAFEIMVAAIIMALMPGLVLIVSGYMIWEVRRSQALSSDMADIARQLLAPIESRGAEFDLIANAVSAHTHRLGGELERAREQAEHIIEGIEKSLDGLSRTTAMMKTDGGMMIDNLCEEGERLRKTCATARDHIDTLTQSFPVQAQVLAEVVRDAEQEMGLAEQLLERRSDSLTCTGADIAGKMEEMEQTAAQSEQRAEAMGELVSGIHKRISEMVGKVENVLNMAEQAREASRVIVCEIEQRLEEAIEKSASVLEKLEHSNTETDNRADDIVALAEKQIALTEEKITVLGNSVYETAAEATRIAETGLNNARARIEKATRLLNHSAPVEEDAGDHTDRPRVVLQKRAEAETEAVKDIQTELASIGMSGSAKVATGRAKRNVGEVVNGANQESVSAGDRNGRSGTSWRDLLASIDDPPGTPKNVEELIRYLQDAGISLRRAVTAPDLRRIAVADREGTGQRHVAIRKAAPGYLRDIEDMFEQSSELRELAEGFVASEKNKALKALSRAEKTRAGANLRLSAYLLIDAALGVDAG